MVKATNNHANAALTADDYDLIGQAILDHLKHESDYLDDVIRFSLKMSDLLQRSSYADQINAEKVENLPTNASGKREDELSRIKEEISNRFSPIEAGRREMQKSLSRLQTAAEETPGLRDLAPNLSPVIREALNQLRLEVRGKLHDVQAITLGNQAVLLYTLDFYQRFMTGLTGEAAPSQAYNSSGKLTSSPHNHLLEKRC